MDNLVAVFDLDETIINYKSLIEVYSKYYSRTNGNNLSVFHSEFERLINSGLSRENLNKLFYKRYFKGMPVQTIKLIAFDWIEEVISSNTLFNDQVVIEIRKHQKNGFRCVILTGSFREIVRPIANKLSIQDYICAPLEEKNGVYTGNLYDEPTIGKGKAKAFKYYCHTNNININHSYAYGDDISDVDFMSCVGNPIVVPSSNDSLLKYGKSAGWVSLQ